MKRRYFTKKMVELAGLGILPAFYAWQIEPFWLEFVEKSMSIKNLPPHLEKCILMHISDIHVGNMFDWNYIINSFKEAQKLDPDFVVYTGDYVSYQGEEQIGQLTNVLKHAVRGKKGTVGILGNHDYGKDWAEADVADSVTRVLRQSSIQILRNEQVEVDGLNFIGFDDYWATNFYPGKVMTSYNSKKANVLLCHNPDVCDLDVWNGYKGWILSGHTHGGQCKPPFLNPPILPVKNKKYTAGRIDLEDERTLYINRALGHLLQVRFNVRPEITLFKLTRA